AEDGIRDRTVTGVQTCALPIFVDDLFVDGPANTLGAATVDLLLDRRRVDGFANVLDDHVADRLDPPGFRVDAHACHVHARPRAEIGRASCRERVEISVGAGTRR